MDMNVISGVQADISQYDLPVQLFKVLGHPARLAILEILREGEQCVCHMETYLGQRQAYISQQLSVLREAGLIMDRRDGWNIFYRVTDESIYALLDLVSKQTGQNEIAPTPMTTCECPRCQKKNRTSKGDQNGKY